MIINYKRKDIFNLYCSINIDSKIIMDINKELFRIVNNLIIFEKNLYYEYEYDYTKSNFLGKKRNSDNNNKFNSQNINNLNVINNNENENKEILQNYINYLNILNRKKKNNNLNYNNKEFMNNEKLVKKYNKNVYINKFLLKGKKKKNKKDIEKKRSSKYRGVSKNGIGWQVLMKFKKNKTYIGTYYSEELAARIYDIVSIKRMGINAKTNFLYNNEQISRILEANLDFKSQNISKIISELIK